MSTETPTLPPASPAKAFLSPGRVRTPDGLPPPLVPWQRETPPGAVEPLRTTPFMIGHERKADVVWTRHEFLSLCRHMMNGNEPDFFMLAFRDREEQARFAKSRKPVVERRASWAWDTVTGRAKSPSGIGFYPRNPEGKTRWAAMDFDAHGGEQEDRDTARRRAMDAFHYFLNRHPQLFVALATSGGGGWHLFPFTEEFHPCEEWILLMRQVADFLGIPIKKGILEIFPSETRGGTGYGIRAPGTWNPKTGECGGIVFENVTRLIQKKSGGSFFSEQVLSPSSSPESDPLSPALDMGSSSSQRERERENHFLAQGTGGVSAWKSGEAIRQFHDREFSPIGELERFAIRAPRTRRAQLARVIGHVFRQIGRAEAEAMAAAQFHDAKPAPRSDLAEHLRDFIAIWNGLQSAFLKELSAPERRAFDALATETERDAFKILRSFAAHAEGRDFPVAVENFGRRLGITREGAGKMRRKFCGLGIMRQTAPAITNKAAARFEWTAYRDTIA